MTEGADGNLYGAAAGNHRIRRVSVSGEVITIAGTGTAGTADGSGDVATFIQPYGIVAVGEALIVTDRLGQTVRQIGQSRHPQDQWRRRCQHHCWRYRNGIWLRRRLW